MTLDEVRDSICIESTADFNETLLQKMFEAKMPGWRIETWDCDEYSTSLTQCVVDYILGEFEEGRTQIQHCEWCTDSCDGYFYIVASHRPKD